ncbi:hypothetical protein DPMN_003132 [Dreissena polymorpha]|uniref:Uncharacterized protein n=1 Tax=Dreissena polymorpha TaxID=45954 RepID=A0A9D4MNP1_DREPO|nr:hypothetical protein DPMN_003132 [Dreissena polymorpha]
MCGSPKRLRYRRRSIPDIEVVYFSSRSDFTVTDQDDAISCSINAPESAKFGITTVDTATGFSDVILMMMMIVIYTAAAAAYDDDVIVMMMMMMMMMSRRRRRRRWMLMLMMMRRKG